MNKYEIREYDIDDPEIPKLFLQSWNIPSKTPIGCLLITHGMAEHTECYDHLAKALCDEGWMVFGWDLQGHGRSQGKRGYVKNFHEFARDLKSIIKKLKDDETLPTQNLHLFGHSMGGLITLLALVGDQPPKVSSVILSNPALKIAVEVPKFKEIASHWINQLAPTYTLNNEIRYDRLSRDPAVVEAYSRDPLRHTKISAPLFLGMIEAQAEVREKIAKINIPLFFQISGQDKIINPQMSLNFYKDFDGQKKIKLYEDSFHEVYNDTNKQEAIDDLIEFLGEYKQ